MGVLNFKLLVEYDGTAFHGWQFQRRERTVQAELEAALQQVTAQQEVTVIGAGRTDAGVHARGQVASVKLDTTIPAEQLRLAVNSHLAEDVRVQAIEVAPDDFHARKSAVRRRYSYTLTTARPVLGRQYVWPVRYPLDRDLLMQCAEQVIGRHDFAGFARANASADASPSTGRRPREWSWRKCPIRPVWPRQKRRGKPPDPGGVPFGDRLPVRLFREIVSNR